MKDEKANAYIQQPEDITKQKESVWGKDLCDLREPRQD